MASKLPRGRTTPDLVADALREDLASGRIPLGAALRQEELAQRFGVSRIPIREALQRLENEGLVVIYPNRGAFAASLSGSEAREIIDLRLLIEVDLIARAVPRMGSREVDRIEVAAAIAAGAAATPAWSETDRNFHEALYAPADRPRQLSLALSLRDIIARHAAAHERLPRLREEWLADHQTLVEDCRRGDTASARRHLYEHIEKAGAFLIEEENRSP